MSATGAQLRDVAKVTVALRELGVRATIYSLSRNQRAAVLTDWLVHSVGLTAGDLEDLGNQLGRQAHLMSRDRP